MGVDDGVGACAGLDKGTRSRVAATPVTARPGKCLTSLRIVIWVGFLKRAATDAPVAFKRKLIVVDADWHGEHMPCHEAPRWAEDAASPRQPKPDRQIDRFVAHNG